MLRKRVTLIVCGIVAAGLLAGGCGSSDSSDSPESSGSAPTRSEFIAQADKVCSKSNAKVQSELTKKTGNTNTLDLISNVIVPNLESQFDQISKLTPPEGDSDQIDAIVSAGREGVAKLKDNPASITGTDSNPLTEASNLAKQYGLKVCGQG